MNKTLEVLSDIIVYNKYAKYIPQLKRRETWSEIVTRYIEMIVKKYPHLSDEIYKNSAFILNKKVLPLDLTKILEEEDQTDLSGELACSGGGCEIL